MAKRFSDRSTPGQVLTFVALCVLIVAGAWQVVIGPARVGLASRRSRVAELETKVARASITAATLPVLQRDLRAVENALRKTTAVLPDEKDPQDVLRNLHELARDSALEVTSFAPKAIAARIHYSEWPIEVGLSGGYHDLGRFFDRIATMPRLMSVSDLQIKLNPKPTGRDFITATCVATTYVFKKDVPAEASGAAAPAMAGGAI